MTDNILQIIKTIQSHGYQAVLAGGCVRDFLLNVAPNDYDIATDATPDQIESIFPRTIAIGKAFGVINLLFNGEEYEVATFRKDGQYSDGRRPDSVEFSSMKEDASRRDLTINGLFYDPTNKIIHDFVGGQTDLNQKILRFIGIPDERIQEDHLRMLRYIRFAVRFSDFKIDPRSFEAVVWNAEKISSVSAERIREELVKILSYDKPRFALQLLHDSRLLSYILPEVVKLLTTPQSPKWHPEGNVWEHTIRCMENLGEKNDVVRWAALLHDIAKPICFGYNESGNITSHGHDYEGSILAETILQRLKFPNDFIEEVCAIINDHMKAKDAIQMKKSTLKRFLAKPHFHNLMNVCRADSLGATGQLDWYDFIMEKFNSYEPEQIKPKPLIGGQELIELGFKPGPIFSNILDTISTYQLEEIINTPEEAIQIVKRVWGDPGGQA